MNEICVTEEFRKMDEKSLKKLMDRMTKNKAFMP
jgi:hypothetical protein